VLVVVFGPQTRLARALLASSSWASGTTFLLVARHITEYDALRVAQPGAALYQAWEPGSVLVDEGEAVAIVCCAFGPIHPGAAVAADDLRRADADCRALGAILRKYSELRLHLLLISTVLALCPRPGREYYAGWKNVVEGLVRQAVEPRREAGLSVFYPGRLVERKTLATPASMLQTSYRELAEEVVSDVRQNRSRRAVLGVDSRLWLTLRCLGLGWSAVTGRR
jgi:hypothetical protein